MGSGPSTTLCVDDVTTGHVEGFAKHIFIKYEYQTLKVFCNTYGIKQHHLVTVFKSYLSHDEVFLIDFRVRTDDLKKKFLRHTRLNNELADVFFPTIYTIPFKGIEPPTVNNEFTFPRFAVLSYLFGMQQLPDLFIQYFALLRRNLNLKISAFFYYFNIENMLKYLTEELKRTTALRVAMESLGNESPDREIALRDVVKMGLKYPILFYSLVRFRRLFMRYVFGDKFWKDRKSLKLKMRLEDVQEHFHMDQVSSRFINEKIAVQYTAQAIITDIAAGVGADDSEYRLNIVVLPYVLVIDEQICYLLKDKLGYKVAKELIDESGLPLTFSPIFLPPYHTLDTTAAELEELEKEAADYSHALSNLSKSRRSRDNSDSDDSGSDSLEDEEEEENEEEEEQQGGDVDKADAGVAVTGGENDSKSLGSLSKLSRGSSVKSLLGGMMRLGSSKRFIIPQDEGDDDEDEGDEDKEQIDDKAVEGDVKDGAEEKSDSLPHDKEANEDVEDVNANDRERRRSSGSRKSKKGAPPVGILKSASSSKMLTKKKSKDIEMDDNEEDSDEETIDNSKSLQEIRALSREPSTRLSATSQRADGQVTNEESVTKPAFKKQQSLGYDFNAMMHNLDASDGDTTEEVPHKKKHNHSHNDQQQLHHHHHGHHDDEHIVIDKTPVKSGIQVIYDAQHGRHFKYNVISGKSTWAIDVVSGGSIIKQIWN